MKQLVTALMAGFLGLALTASAMAVDFPAEEKSVKKPAVVIEGKSTITDLVSVENGRMLVPLRLVAEGLGCEVSWLEKTKEIVVQGNHELKLKVGENLARVDGKEMQLPAPVRIVNSRAIVPLRFLGENLDFSMTYNQQNNTAYLFREKQDFYLYAQNDLFTLVAANHTAEPIEYTFSSGMTHDFVLKQKGQEIWRWSADKAFIMLFSKQTLNPGECWVYSSKLDKEVPPGNYTLESYFTGRDGRDYIKDPKPAAAITYKVPDKEEAAVLKF